MYWLEIRGSVARVNSTDPRGPRGTKPAGKRAERKTSTQPLGTVPLSFIEHLLHACPLPRIQLGIAVTPISPLWLMEGHSLGAHRLGKPVLLYSGLLWLTDACPASFPVSLMEGWPQHHPACVCSYFPECRGLYEAERQSLGCKAITALLKPSGPVAFISTENIYLLFQPQVLSRYLSAAAGRWRSQMWI